MSQGTLSGSLRVVVADDHTFYRDGLVGMLEDAGIDVVADVATGEAALVAVADAAPDAVVMDMNMPGLGGIETTRLLVDQCPGCRVVMLTVSQEEEHVLSGLLAGARGFVLKDGPVTDLVSAISVAADGRTYLSDRVSARLVERVQRARDRGRTRFSSHEMDLLVGLSRGESLAQVSATLGLSDRRVRRVAASALSKLQSEGRGDIAVGAMRDRIV